MSPGATFERVYSALKLQLMSGVPSPGRRLEPAALCEELNASITPVRDALHRLVGERLVTAPRNDGFHVPRLTEAALRELYAWNEDLLLIALRRLKRGAPPPAAGEPADDLATRSAAIFLAVAALSGNRENIAAVAALNDRIHPVRIAESRLIADVPAELAAIATSLAACDSRTLRRAVIAYHRRRIRLTPAILAELGSEA